MTLCICLDLLNFMGFPGGTANERDIGDTGLIYGFDPWVRKIPWRRKWQPTLVFFLGKWACILSALNFTALRMNDDICKLQMFLWIVHFLGKKVKISSQQYLYIHVMMTKVITKRKVIVSFKQKRNECGMS